MKKCGVLALVASILCSGCASAIYRQGRFHDVLKSGSDRARIHTALGQPVSASKEQNFGGSYHEDFIVPGPVFDRRLVDGANMGAAMTLGFTEFVTVPQALW